MNELTTTNGTELTAQEQALELHQNILYNYRLAAHHLTDAAYGLKRMRDTKAYKELGMATFEEYTEQMAGIKARQAYTYIAALERLGAPMMEQHAALGITKLSLLAEITPVEREAFAAENDLAGMTVKEIEALVEENNRRGEQISLFAEEQKVAELAAETQEEEIRRLKEELEDLKNRPAKVETVNIVQPDEEQLEQIRQEARAEAAADTQAAVDKAVEEAMAAVKTKVDKSKDKLAKSESKLKAAEEEKDKALARAAALEEQLAAANATKDEEIRRAALAGDGDIQVANVHFEQLQGSMNRLLQLIAEIKEKQPEKGARLGGAMVAFLEQVLPECRKLYEEASHNE